MNTVLTSRSLNAVPGEFEQLARRMRAAMLNGQVETYGDQTLSDSRPASLKAGQPYDLGLKAPCQCGSGKRFKRCCYEAPTRGWCWIALGSRNLVPVVVKDESEPDAQIILAHPTYKEALTYATDAQMVRRLGQEVFIVRMTVENLAAHVEQGFPKGSKTLLVVGAEIGPDGEAGVYEITP